MSAAYGVPLGGALFALEVLRGVLALLEPRPVLIAYPLVLGRIEVHVIDVAGILHAYPSAGEAAHHLPVRHLDQHGTGLAAAHGVIGPAQQVR